MAEGEQQLTHHELERTDANPSQQLEDNVISYEPHPMEPNTTATGPSAELVAHFTDTGVNYSCGVKDDQIKEQKVSLSLLPPGIQSINSQNVSVSTTTCHSGSVLVPETSTIAAESFLFCPSVVDSKDLNQLPCASEDTGNTISLPIRHSSFSDTNPLTPARSKVGSDYGDQGTPLTPTANLKILLSAASPAIRERELMQQNARNVCRSILTDTASTEEFEEYSRKQKSLSLLCSRFLEAAETGDIGKDGIFTIEEAATKLDINRRRVYDIVNVLESLEMVSKQKIKNEYKWHGRDHLAQTLARLKEQECSPGGQHAGDHSCAECGQEYGQEYVPRSEKSLGYLCQKFVLLFLECPERELTLEAAARILLGEEGKVRRLYDVANILTSLGLISKKVFGGGTNFRKPGFYWSGPVVLPMSKGGRSNSEALQSRKAQRMFVKSLVCRNSVLSPMENLPALKTKSPQSAPSSPVKQKTPLKRYLSYDTTKKKRVHSLTTKTPEVRKMLKMSPRDVPEKDVKEFEDELFALLGKFPSIAQCFSSLPELEPKQRDINNPVGAAKNVFSPDSVQTSSSQFHDFKPPATARNDDKENAPSWSIASSEHAPSAKTPSPNITLSGQAFSTNLPLARGVFPLSSKYPVTNMPPSMLVSSNSAAADGLITVTPIYTRTGPNVVMHNTSLQSPALQISDIKMSVASLLSAACKPSNIPTVGQLLQSNELFTRPQNTEQKTTTA